MRRRNSKYVPIDGRRVISMIEHQEIGELLLTTLPRHVIERKKPFWHAGEREQSFALVPHHHIQSEMIARQCQCAPARIPDRRRKRTTEKRPNIVTNFFPPSEEQARVWPRRDRKSTRLNSSHVEISYAVFCLKKKKRKTMKRRIKHQTNI